jgi:hypothetical protein
MMGVFPQDLLVTWVAALASVEVDGIEIVVIQRGWEVVNNLW